MSTFWLESEIGSIGNRKYEGLSMKKRKMSRILASILLVLVLAIVFSPIAFANSAEPPNLTIIVSFPPDDLTLLIRFEDGRVTNTIREHKMWESYYQFFYYMIPSAKPSLERATLVVQSSKKSFECLLPDDTFSKYDNLLTLNFMDESIATGQSPIRVFLLVSMRVILTMLIEGLIFLAFGYRKKVSWVAFIVINLITQGALNALLTGPNLGSYWILGFILIEFLIFIVEMIAFPSILKEHKKGRAIAYAFIANLASLVLGGVLISNLPV